MSLEDLEADLRQAVASEGPQRLDAVRDRLRAKANPNVHLADNETPLSLALRHRDAELCRLLLLYQADPCGVLEEAQNRSDPAAASITKWVAEDPAEVLEILEAAAVDAASSHDVHSLGRALASLELAGGDESCVRGRGLLHCCARNAGLVAQRGRRGGAAARGTVRALIGYGAQLMAVEDGKTALELALAAPSLELARSLLEEGADPEQVSENEETLLMKAACAGHFASCELLLHFRADPLRRRLDGQTAITLASGEDVPRQVLVTLRSGLTRGEQSSGDPTGRTRRAFSKAAEQPQRRSGAFSKLQAEETAFEQAKSQSYESESETRLGEDTDEVEPQSTTRRFSMSDVDQEMYNSAEGLLNQVDLEEAYDDDWTVQATGSFSPREDYAHWPSARSLMEVAG